MNSQINDLAPEEYALLDPVPVISSDPIQSSAQCINSKFRNPNKSIACAALNVCGLRRKILFPDFCELVDNYDIFVSLKQNLTIMILLAFPIIHFWVRRESNAISGKAVV